ncbi:GNAT family N-acetyltransferase [Salipaludibacillus agaradhaerens]|uniref:GNAT family N-acetyltransferase n=1 Tax=Salipaludibacillus agaradhaerens TaxID=76935 RepID=UPI0009985B0C|nr:GNAT family protein [Salipaludibacillus agaradhaerens]
MIKLVPYTDEHSIYLKQWVKNFSPAQLMEWGGPSFHYPLTDRQLTNYITASYEVPQKVHIFTVFSQTTDSPIGHISLGKLNLQHQSARIGKVLLAPEARKNGYTPLLLKRILSYAFNTLQLHKVSLGVFDTNIRARHIYEKFGFIQEGYFRDHVNVDNAYWGMYEMSILEHEWRAMSLNHE